MNRGTYTGETEDLKGRTALLRVGSTPGKMLAQFDHIPTEVDGKDLSYGWHEFDKADFEMTETDAASWDQDGLHKTFVRQQTDKSDA